MEFCPYCKIEDYNGLCQCNKTGDICPLTYRCHLEHRHKPLKSMDNCLERNKVERPKNGHKVRFEKHGVLFVEVDNMVIELSNPFDYTPTYVLLSKRNGQYKIITK